MEEKGIWTSKYMAPHDSTAKNKGEYDNCVACYFRDEQRAQRGMTTTVVAAMTRSGGSVREGDRTVGTVSRRCSATEQRRRR